MHLRYLEFYSRSTVFSGQFPTSINSSTTLPFPSWCSGRWTLLLTFIARMLKYILSLFLKLFVCSGTLISIRHVLTSVFCLKSSGSQDNPLNMRNDLDPTRYLVHYKAICYERVKNRLDYRPFNSTEVSLQYLTF